MWNFFGGNGVMEKKYIWKNFQRVLHARYLGCQQVCGTLNAPNISQIGWRRLREHFNESNSLIHHVPFIPEHEQVVIWLKFMLPLNIYWNLDHVHQVKYIPLNCQVDNRTEDEIELERLWDAIWE